MTVGASTATLELVLTIGLHGVLHLGVWIASAFGYAAAAVVSFVLQRAWVFAPENRTRAQFTRYGVFLGGNLAGAAVLVPLIASLGPDYRLAKLSAMLLAGCVNFWVLRLWVFPSTPAEGCCEETLGCGGLCLAA